MASSAIKPSILVALHGLEPSSSFFKQRVSLRGTGRFSVKDIHINMAISAVFTAWILIGRNAEWKPLQFLAFAYFYRVFEKLKASEPEVAPVLNEYREDQGSGLRMGKRVLRSLKLVFGSMEVSFLGYTGVLNLIEYIRGYIPVIFYINQELVVTIATCVLLYFMASYYIYIHLQMDNDEDDEKDDEE